MRAMVRRILGVGCALTVASVVLAAGPGGAIAATKGECRVRSLPGFVAQGALANAASVADVVEVACHEEPGATVTIEDPELSALCGNVLNWAQPNPYTKVSGTSFGVTLDRFGNAVAVLWAHGCRAGPTTITARLGAAPNTVTTTSFFVYPAMTETEGFEALPSKQTESGGGVATIVTASVPRGVDARFEISASNLLHRCRLKPHVHWIYQGKERAGGKTATITLDNNGLGFAIVLGAECQVGESLVTGEEVNSPFRSFVTYFDVLPDEELV